MLLGSDATLGAAAAWLLLCGVAWLGIWRWAGPWSLSHPRTAIVLAAGVARVVPALALDRGLFFDVAAHWWIGNLVLAGQDVYAAPLALNRYPYPPLHMYLSALMVWVSGGNRGAFLVADKLIPAACGVGIALTVRGIAPRLGAGPRRALVLGLLYGVNPLPVLVTSYHGQLEEIPLLFIALALWAVTGPRQTLRVSALSALLLGIGVAYKSWPLLFLPPLLLMNRGLPRRALYAVLTMAPLAVFLALYGLAHGRTGTIEAARRMIGYKGSTGFCWGYVSAINACWVHPERLRPNPWVLGVNGKLLVVALVLAGCLLLWRRKPLEGMVTLPLAFYLFSPGWGPNYSIWVLPFALLLAARLAVGYTVVMLPIVAATYFDSLYAAYGHNAYSWEVLKPIEAALGLVGWVGVAILLAWVYARREQSRLLDHHAAPAPIARGDEALTRQPLPAATPEP